MTQTPDNADFAKSRFIENAVAKNSPEAMAEMLWTMSVRIGELYSKLDAAINNEGGQI